MFFFLIKQSNGYLSYEFLEVGEGKAVIRSILPVLGLSGLLKQVHFKLRLTRCGLLRQKKSDCNGASVLLQGDMSPCKSQVVMVHQYICKVIRHVAKVRM